MCRNNTFHKSGVYLIFYNDVLEAGGLWEKRFMGKEAYGIRN